MVAVNKLLKAGAVYKINALAGLFLCMLFFVAVAFVPPTAIPQPGFSNQRIPTYTFIDKTGKTVFKVALDKFATFGSFSEGLCSFVVVTPEGSKSGFIDRTGKQVIPPQFALAQDFHNGRALVQVFSTDKPRKGLFGFIDKSGKFVVPAKYYVADSFSEGLAYVQAAERGAGAFIDPDGKQVISVQHGGGGRFSEGLAGVNGGYIDKTGKLAIRSNRGGRSQFSCGLACREINALSHQYYGVTKNGAVYPENRLYGYIDRNGRFSIMPRFIKSYDFSEDRAVVELPLSLPPDLSVTGSHGVYGFIDTAGEVVTVLRTRTEPHKFSNGLAAVQFSGSRPATAKGEWGYIGKDGRVVISPQFTQPADFAEGLANVEGGYIDTQGNMRIPTDSTIHAPFSEGLASVVFY